MTNLCTMTRSDYNPTNCTAGRWQCVKSEVLQGWSIVLNCVCHGIFTTSRTSMGIHPLY